MNRRSTWILIVLGVGLIGGTAIWVAYLNRAPIDDAVRSYINEAEFERGMQELLRRKSRCEEEIMTALKRKRPHYEAIVKAVEAQALTEGQSESFYFPRGGSPASLASARGAYSDRAGAVAFSEKNTEVHAYRRKGVLIVKVVICEMGHAGTYQVMYTSKELTEKEIEVELVPHAAERLDPHWWAVIEWY